MTVKMPEPGISLYVQCANGMQIPVISYSKEQMQAYAQAVRDDALEKAATIAEKASRIGVIRSLEATHKAQAAIEIASAIRSLKEQS